MRAPRSPRARGFTLLELLVTIAIITVLLSLLFPAIGSAMAIARSRKCQSGQRSVGFDFNIFADAQLHGYRGRNATSTSFSLAAFIDAQYQTNDFWAWANVDEVELPESDPHLMRCPVVTGPLTLVRGRQAFEGGVAPAERISFGFNVRLHQAEITDPNGPPRAQAVRLSAAILDTSNAPLMWDVDAAAAAERGATPLLSGPGLNSAAVFAGDRYWSPTSRHNGVSNYLFIDGHVEESAHPLNEGWNWGYSPLTR